jgi:DNA-binding transcriptional MerR regulator
MHRGEPKWTESSSAGRPEALRQAPHPQMGPAPLDGGRRRPADARAEAQPAGELPPKLFFRIGEVAGLVGVEPHVLRYWEREFRSIRPTKSAKGQRVYSRKDVENLLRVRDLLYRDGFTIAGAKKRLQRVEEDVAAPAPEVASHLEPSLPAEPSDLEGPKAGAPMDATATPPRSRPHIREKLMELRSEVEAFLAELSGATEPQKG